MCMCMCLCLCMCMCMHCLLFAASMYSLLIAAIACGLVSRLCSLLVYKRLYCARCSSTSSELVAGCSSTTVSSLCMSSLLVYKRLVSWHGAWHATPLVSFVSLCSLSLALDNVNSCLSWATKAERDAGHVLILGSTSSNAHALIGYSSDFPRPPTSLDLSSILP
jgi:hypothetical protein